ncbi:MAG: GMC family oxidoreductase, partial [Rubripirellula sp.]
ARLSDVTAGCWNREKLHRALQSVEQIVRPEYPRWLSVASKAFLRSVDQFPNSNPMAYRRLQKNGTRRSLEVIFNDDRETTDDKKRDPHRGKVEWIRGTVNDIQWRGDQAVGVTMQSTQGACQLSCKDGVILAAGSIGTPAILMRSGVGPKAILTDLGIPVRNDQQAIGQQVGDHLIMPVIFRQKDSKNRFSLDVNPRELARWQTLGTGPASSNLAECGGLFMNDRFQLHVTPTHYLSFPKLDDAAWISIGVNVTQPKSRGELRITSANPDVPPEIHPNYLSHSDDLEETVRGIQFVRGLIQDDALSEIIDCESLPGEKRQSELALQRTIPRYAQTLYHPLGSCPVGTAKSATIDPQFRLRHSDGLWVVDGSIFPGITVGNPNATIMSLAWMAAEEIMKTVKNP